MQIAELEDLLDWAALASHVNVTGSSRVPLGRHAAYFARAARSDRLDAVPRNREAHAIARQLVEHPDAARMDAEPPLFARLRVLQSEKAHTYTVLFRSVVNYVALNKCNKRVCNHRH